MVYNRKPIPGSILIFGAAAHIGGPLAAFLTREAPSTRLRLVTRSPTKAEALRKAFPAAEVVNADYGDPPSMRKAVDGMEGVFVITPAGTDERPAMTHLIDALKASGSVIHLLRQVGLQPEANPRRIPQSLRGPGLSLPIQHAVAKQMLDDSGLPVTYLNCGATFMDNFIVLGMHRGLRQERKLIWPERLIPWIDPREVGEVAARLFLSDNHRHIGQFHTLNNGHDLMRFHEVAELMSEVWNEPIGYDSSKESFFAHYSQIGPRLPILWEFFQYEQDNEVVWARNDFVERILGRKPKTLREWLIEHRDAVLGTAGKMAS
ncbi:MAG TPA: NmrA family NAD(P)-binding protein [Steroidobacteraceae bacterium]|nr:NmrA family NAD(P)-binding protein [Steroidobacteraceae bacterium]